MDAGNRVPSTETSDPTTTPSWCTFTSFMGISDPAFARRETSLSGTSTRTSPDRGFVSTTRPFLMVVQTSMSKGSRSMRALVAVTLPRSVFFMTMWPPENSPASMRSWGSLFSSTLGCFSIPSRVLTSRATAYSSNEGKNVWGPIRKTTNTGTSTAATTLRIVLGHGPVLQVSVDEGIEVAVEHAVHVRRLLAGAVVLYELVRVEYVGADLRTPLDIGLLPALRGDLLLPLLTLEFEEPRPEYPHGHLTVLVLAALVLALRHDARREVRDPDGRVGLVDMLAAGPRGPVGIHLEVFLFDLDLDGFIDDGCDGDRGEAGVPPCAGVERTDSDETMHPALGG